MDILFNYQDSPKNRLQHTVDFNITSKTYILFFFLFVAVVVFIHDKQNPQQLSNYTSKWYIIKKLYNLKNMHNLQVYLHLASYPSILKQKLHTHSMRDRPRLRVLLHPPKIERQNPSLLPSCIRYGNSNS